MADAKEVLKDIEIAEDVKEKIISVINPVLSNYEQSLESERNKLKEAIQTRDTVKEKNRELENKLATGNSQVEELLGAKNKEIEGLSGQLSQVVAERDSLKTFTEQVKVDRKKELIEKVPEGKLRESLSKVESLELLSEQVTAILESMPDKHNSFTPKGGGKAKLVTEGKRWDDFTTEQRIQIREQNNSEYVRLYKSKFGIIPKE